MSEKDFRTLGAARLAPSRKAVARIIGNLALNNSGYEPGVRSALAILHNILQKPQPTLHLAGTSTEDLRVNVKLSDTVCYTKAFMYSSFCHVAVFNCDRRGKRVSTEA